MLLRYVHSGVFTDDWDNQYDSAGQHTDFYLHTLGQYLRYFAGQRPTYIAAEGPEAAKTTDAFDTLRHELGLTAASAPGEQVRLTPPGLDPVDAVVDYAQPNFIGVRSADGLYRFFGRNAFGMPVGLSHHLFAAGRGQGQDPAGLAVLAGWPLPVTTGSTWCCAAAGWWTAPAARRSGPTWPSRVTGSPRWASLAGATAAAELDVTGRYLMPGFIDAHIHADGLAGSRDAQLAALRQGVTTVLIGQDGLSFAPASKATIDAVSQYFGAVNGPCPAELAAAAQ